MNPAINIHVATIYIANQSRPDQRRFVYAYTITISNEGELSAQLISRHWRITDANEKVQEVQGVGVVGEQPVIEPGNSYTYTSGAVLETETGIMEGAYQMRATTGEIFEVPIPAFALVPPHAMH